ncbi:MAG: hypothetical protein JW843_06075 [Candidatus Aminicenantes bacterium]|nr:hypothetical protein [Candidatus Aminicenantes bacterium]
MTFDFLRILVLVSAGLSLAALSAMAVRAFGFGRPRYLSRPQGRTGKGVVYAFGRGMVEKESVTLHRPTFFGGIAYHGAIFVGFAYLFWHVFRIPAAPPVWFFPPVLLGGTLIGLALLVKRIKSPHLRKLSCPDDFFANVLVDLFLAAAFLHTMIPALETAFFILSVVLFLYVPIGKIRHCFFFFYTRMVFAVHFGRRGALPGTSREIRS